MQENNTHTRAQALLLGTAVLRKPSVSPPHSFAQPSAGRWQVRRSWLLAHLPPSSISLAFGLAKMGILEHSTLSVSHHQDPFSHVSLHVEAG